MYIPKVQRSLHNSCSTHAALQLHVHVLYVHYLVHVHIVHVHVPVITSVCLWSTLTSQSLYCMNTVYQRMPVESCNMHVQGTYIHAGTPITGGITSNHLGMCCGLQCRDMVDLISGKKPTTQLWA